ncbi:MBL fold metallo-hydrolase [Candidatus Poribacteria bacterium]|nr:MBL fold metallo-hydrolase [Candidatus Poribacteria bacterium]
MRLRFLGATKNVTGSSYMVELDGLKFLVDCGFYQERELKSRNWGPFPIPPKDIDAVLLTHAHLDHCGLLPKLVKEGFKGHVYCTNATVEITRIVLLDSAHIQEEDAANKRKRHEREGRKGPYPEIPLYTIDDAKKSLPFLYPVNYEEEVELSDNIKATFYDAGHILGSSMIKFQISKNGEKRTIIFSGDVGRWNVPILQDPTVFDYADYVIVESTYGDRIHEDQGHIEESLSEIINSTRKNNGNIAIPSFAIGRTQEVLYYLNKLLYQKKIPHLMVFVDSPMAIDVTEVFKHHSELFDKDTIKLILRRESPFDFPNLKLTRTVSESKAINNIKGTSIIIAGSGMCNEGRIKHHLVQNISRPESTILFVGYQAEGTLGRQIVDGNEEVRIFGQMHPVRARIEQIQGFSAHGDKEELIKWLSGLENRPSHVFVTHGESEVSNKFAEIIRENKNWDVSVPNYMDEAILS